MNLKRAGKWGVAGILGAAGTLGAITAVILDARSGSRGRRKIEEKSREVVRRERAHINAMFGAAKRDPERSERTSMQLRAAVLAALEAKGATGIEVRVRAGGAVRLRGEVAKLADIRALEAAVRKVDGVAEIDNLLRLSA